jgi:hypothetical protein
MPEWAKVNHYFVFKGKTDLSSIRSAFTKDNENTTKIFIEYSKTLDNILLHYYDTQYRINTFAPYNVVPGTLRYGDSLKDVSLSLEYGNFWLTTATYHRSDVVEIFDFTFPEDSASILQTPKVVLSRDEVLSIHKRKLEFDVPKEEDFDVQIKEEIPWFDYTNLEEG